MTNRPTTASVASSMESRPISTWSLWDFFRVGMKNMPASKYHGKELAAALIGIAGFIASAVPFVLLVMNTTITEETTQMQARLFLFASAICVALVGVGFLAMMALVTKSAILRKSREMKSGAPCRSCGQVLTMQQREHTEAYVNPARIIKARADWLREYNRVDHTRRSKDLEAAGRL